MGFSVSRDAEVTGGSTSESKPGSKTREEKTIMNSTRLSRPRDQL